MDALFSKGRDSFTDVDLLDLQRKKPPKRLVYFSDGILEEYSSDEEEPDCVESQPLIDPKNLSWMPYIGYMFWVLGSRTLAVCDYLGEHLAWFFGITSPKFQYELDQFERLRKEEEEIQKHRKAESAGWISNADKKEENTVDFQPKSQQKLEQDIEKADCC